MFVIQEEIAASVVQALSVRLDEPVPQSSIGPGAEAYDMYLQGRHHFYRGRDRGDQAGDHAVPGSDPDRPQLLPGAGRARRRLLVPPPLLRAASRDPGRCRVLRASGGRADASMAEPNASLGFALGAAGRYEEAKESFSRALSLPGGRFESAYLFGRTLFAQGTWTGPARCSSPWSGSGPRTSMPPPCSPRVLRALGDEKGSLVMQRRVHDLVDYHLRLVPDDARASADGAAALVALGRVGEGLSMAERALAITHSPMPYYAAGALAQAGQEEPALDALEQVIAAGWSHHDFLEHDPDWAGLRAHARFRAALTRLS